MPREDEDGGFSSVGEVSPFAQSMNAQPWLRGSMTPWHMWGSSDRLTYQTASFGTGATQTKQLAKVSYGRPETWHWLFALQIYSSTPAPAGVQNVGIEVHFDLTVGLGRSMTQIASFETFTALWGLPGFTFPPTAPFYSTMVHGPGRIYNQVIPPASQTANPIEQIVAQDIQCNARIVDIGNIAASIDLQVSAFFAPKTHIRPDWLQLRSPPEQQFPGSEVGAR